MCGIVGYVGGSQAAPLLLCGLEKLEYRGYDSAGIAVHDGKQLQVVKSVGRLKNLCDLTEKGSRIKGTVGIGHTRWATHGEPTEVNAHPHVNEQGTIGVVHNGIIENYLEWKEKLEQKGHVFQSDTDTEVIAKLLDEVYKGEPLEAIAEVMNRIRGSYALGILFEDCPRQLYAVRKDSPLIVGKMKDGYMIASDIPALLKYTRDVIFLENKEVLRISATQLEIFGEDGTLVQRELTHIPWNLEEVEKGGYAHFMLKEIYEQPKAIFDTFSSRITRENRIRMEELGMTREESRRIEKIAIVACGSAYHVGVTAKYILESMTKIPVEVDMASEFRYRDPLLTENTLVIVISQSGETADALAALREAKKRKAQVLGIVNVAGSSIAREADHVLYTLAGAEIAVATTKAYTAQLISVYLLGMRLADDRDLLPAQEREELVKAMKKLPGQVQSIFAQKENIQRLAEKYLKAQDVFFIGRGIDYAIAMEGSLKLKEISYIHSEAYAAGELKHGTLSLIEEKTVVVAVLTQEDLYQKTISNVAEGKSRGASVLAVADEGKQEVMQMADDVIYIPRTHRYFTNSLAIIPLQLFGYYIALGRGCDIDKPRNLAKSVTVE